MLETTVPARMEYMDGVLDEMDAYLETESCPKDLRTRLEIVLEELFTNVASYAYPAGEGEFSLSCSMEHGTGFLKLKLKDRGIPFNPLERKKPDIEKPIEDRPIGGLGIYMVIQFVDEAQYEYRDGFNILTLKKRIHP